MPVKNLSLSPFIYKTPSRFNEIRASGRGKESPLHEAVWLVRGTFHGLQPQPTTGSGPPSTIQLIHSSIHSLVEHSVSRRAMVGENRANHVCVYHLAITHSKFAHPKLRRLDPPARGGPLHLSRPHFKRFLFNKNISSSSPHSGLASFHWLSHN